jgi:hypothetical protein
VRGLNLEARCFMFMLGSQLGTLIYDENGYLVVCYRSPQSDSGSVYFTGVCLLVAFQSNKTKLDRLVMLEDRLFTLEELEPEDLRAYPSSFPRLLITDTRFGRAGKYQTEGMNR